MILTGSDRIAAYRSRGWWGHETCDDVFVRNVRAFPDREAVVDAPNRETFTEGAPRRLTYRQLDDMVDRLCSVLLQYGLKKDDVIAVQLPNVVELTAVYLVAARLGLIVTPVPVQYRVHELEFMLAHTGARAVVTCSRIGTHEHAAMFVDLTRSVASVQRIFTFGPGAPVGAIAIDPLLEEAVDQDRIDRYRATIRPSADDVLTICWTSGTEARPKGVPRSHNEWLIIAPNIIELANLESGCRQLNPSPMVNMSGLSINFATWLALGGTVVHHHPFDLTVFVGQLREERIDYTVAPPAVLNMMLQNADLLQGLALTRLKAIGSGGAPLSSWMVEGFAERGVTIVNHYGSNEGASLAGTYKDIPEPAARAEYFPRLGVDGVDTALHTNQRNRTRLVDLATGLEITEPGVAGELRFNGPTVFSGYWNAPEVTKRTFDDQGFYCTGDLFEIAGEKKQFYKYVGRSKDIVVRGGTNISSEEIETLVLGHPAVKEAAVIGRPDPIMGERVCVCVVPRDDRTVTLDDIVQYLRNEKRVAVYKLPEHLLIVDALPRNAVGKILKRELRAYQSGLIDRARCAEH